jgi:hypothetical protein
MSDQCSVCGLEIEPSPNTGRVSKWLVMEAAKEGWFFQKDGTTYCPEHVPSWVGSWRRRQAEKKKRSTA